MFQALTALIPTSLASALGGWYGAYYWNEKSHTCRFPFYGKCVDTPIGQVSEPWAVVGFFTLAGFLVGLAITLEMRRQEKKQRGG
jgi:hypothetical protein